MHPSAISKFTLAIDKLDLMVVQHNLLSSFTVDFTALTRMTGQPTYTVNDVVLTKMEDRENKEPNYHLGYFIECGGIRIGLLYMDKTKFYFGDRDLIKLKVSKDILYTAWLPTLEHVLSSLNLRFRTVTYIELALDTNADAWQLFYDFFYATDTYHLVGCTKDSIDTISKKYRDGSFNESLYIGKADKQVVVYNKSLHLQAEPNAAITAFHATNGLDTNKDIQRVELRLKNTALKRYATKYEYRDGSVLCDSTYSKLSKFGKDYYYVLKDGRIVDIQNRDINKDYYNSLTTRSQAYCTKVTRKSLLTGSAERELALEDLADYDFLFSLYVEKFLFEFRAKDNNNVSRCTPVPFIDFTNAKKMITTNTMSLIPSNDQNKLKQLIRLNLKQYRTTGIQAFKDAAETTAKQSALDDFYDKVWLELGLSKPKLSPYDTVPATKEETLADIFGS